MRNPLITKIDTPAAQGAESYIEFRRPTWGERRAMRKEIVPLEGDALETFAFGILFERLESWNWKDANGKTMPLPKTTIELETYTEEEVDTLFDIVSRAIRGTLRYTEEDAKN